MTEQDAQTLIAILDEAVRAADLERDGYMYAGAKSRFLMKTHVPVLTFTRDGTTLAFIVTPKDPSGKSFKRSACFDLSYFSEDVPDEEQGRIYARDREQIERVGKWLVTWDR